MSPNQRWIVFQKFYPLHGVEAGSELLVYDLTKTPDQNRPDPEIARYFGLGRLIFPPDEDELPYNNIGVPRNQIHSLDRRGYWAADSHALLFRDQLPDRTEKLILVTLDGRGRSAVWEHEVTASEMCGREVPKPDPTWYINRAEIGPEQTGNRTIWVDVSSTGDNRCSSHTLQLSTRDFRPAKPEVHDRELPSGGAIREGPSYYSSKEEVERSNKINGG